MPGLSQPSPQRITQPMKRFNGPQRIRQLLAQPGIIRSLGAHDVFTALIVERAGFETVFIGGFGTSASMLGLPDLNFLTMTEMAEAADEDGLKSGEIGRAHV